jgi:hypothetical protein
MWEERVVVLARESEHRRFMVRDFYEMMIVSGVNRDVLTLSLS